jgi:hypothetical protein
LRAVSIDGSGLLVTQAPALQSCPAAHVRPHAPQCAKDVANAVSQPLDVLPSQHGAAPVP